MIKSLIVFAFLAIALPFNSSAQESDRIARLEREIQDLKARVSKLEARLGAQSKAQEPAASRDGAKTVANWRKLSTGMSPSDVRRVLGEPERTEDGDVMYWHYPNGGIVTFTLGKVYKWAEPRK